MKITFLFANTPLTKQFTKTATGIDKISYPFVRDFTSITESISNLTELEKALKKHAKLGHCLLKGNTNKPLLNESRAGSTDTQAQTSLLVLDIDGLPAGTTPDDVMKSINLRHISYIVQFSASSEITDQTLKCHIYIWLAKSYAAPLIKQYLIQLNHEIKLFQANLRLTSTGNTLSWPLDITACQNDKLIYIAPPILIGLTDPIKQRIKLVKRVTESFTLPTINATETNKERTQLALNTLREAAGLPKRKTVFKQSGGFEVLSKPGACTVTGLKHERGFVYMNLNGGDSWGYYHPENNPDYIHNFKSEPVYLTKELLPDYWAELVNSPCTTADSQGLIYFVLCDIQTGQYLNAIYNQAIDELTLYPAKNETQVRHFAKEHGMPLGDFIPTWTIAFDPTNSTSPRVDFSNKLINTFNPTVYMRATPKTSSVCPPTIYKTIDHALGNDPVITSKFMHWLAFIFQTGMMTKTAWVFHGRTGTGKGVLFKHILAPLFRYVTLRRMEELNEQYNGFMRDMLIVAVDEIQISTLKSEEGVMAKLRNFITDSPIQVRNMYASAAEYPNYTNWLFFSNKPDAVQVTTDDRRTNVGKYQPVKLEITDQELDTIQLELTQFAEYLHGMQVNKQAVSTPAQTEDRDRLISISQSSIDTVADAVLNGNFEFFMDHMPTGVQGLLPHWEQTMFDTYKRTLTSLLARTNTSTGVCNLGRDELRALFDYTVGDMPASPNKFTSRLKHHRIYMAKVWIDGRTVNGIQTKWVDYETFSAYSAILNPVKLAAVK